MPIATQKAVPQEFLDQMKSNLSKDNVSDFATSENNQTVTIKTTAIGSVNTQQEEKKDKYADVMNIRLSKGRRNEIKAFCSSCGVSITQYIESSFEYLSKEVSAGRIVISKGGINRVE